MIDFVIISLLWKGLHVNLLYLQAVWAQTTGVTRTQMTMAALLAGLFPPKDTAMEWNRRLNWQPIPIFSEPLDEDSVSEQSTNISTTFIVFVICFSCCSFELLVQDTTKL